MEQSKASAPTKRSIRIPRRSSQRRHTAKQPAGPGRRFVHGRGASAVPGKRSRGQREAQRTWSDRLASVELSDAAAIAQVLGESNVQAIATGMELIPVDMFKAMLARVADVLDAGGMLREDGQGMRTPGGTLFREMKESLAPEQYKMCFAHRQAELKAAKRARVEKKRARMAAIESGELPGAAAAATAAAAPAGPAPALPNSNAGATAAALGSLSVQPDALVSAGAASGTCPGSTDPAASMDLQHAKSWSHAMSAQLAAASDGTGLALD